MTEHRADEESLAYWRKRVQESDALRAANAKSLANAIAVIALRERARDALATNTKFKCPGPCNR